MSENGRNGSLNDFAHTSSRASCCITWDSAPPSRSIWALLPDGARAEVMGVMSSLIAFRTGGTPSGLKLDAAGMPVADFVAPCHSSRSLSSSLR